MNSVVLYINSLNGGGAERVITTLYQNPPENTNVTLIINEDNQDYHVSPDNLIILNKKKEEGHIKKRGEWTKNQLKTLINYFKYLNTEKPDVAVSFLTLPNIMNMLSCLFTKTKCIISLRNNPEFSVSFLDKSLIKTGLVLAHVLAKKIIVNSNDLRDLLIRRYHFSEKKIICIYNPKDINSILKTETDDFPVFFDTDRYVLLSVGRLIPQKGYSHLFRVLSELQKKYPCKLAICGKGELEEELKILARRLGIEDSVEFLGWQPQVFKFMKAADIFVMSSIVEGQPNALIEALICGCPCVCVDCDYGPQEILENGKYGLLSRKITKAVREPIHDPLTDEEQDLYDKLELMITNEGLREDFKRKSIDIRTKFDSKMLIHTYYETILEGVKT